MAGSSYFPRQDIPQREKTDSWKSLHLDYAEGILKNYGTRRARMNKSFNGYNGITDDESIKWLTARYGQADKAPYISYRVGRTKIDLLQGEWLRRPLISTVTTVNSRAIADKMRQYDFLKGAMIAREEIETIKGVAGVDVMEGMDIPKNETEFAKMNFKDKCEDVMQIILNKQIERLDVKKRLSESFLNTEITNYCGALVEMDERGRVSVEDIDPKDCIFEAIKGDDYAEKSPIKGCVRRLPVHQILMRYNLDDDQRNILDAARKNPGLYVGAEGKGRGFMSFTNGELLCDVIHIEWDSVTPSYFKQVAPTHPQALESTSVDGTEILPIPIPTEEYEKNIEYHKKNEKKGYYKIITKYADEKYEATRIGGLIDINMRKVQGKKRSIDNMSEILSSTYIFYVHGRVNGTTVSLQELMENFDNLYNIVRFMMNRELAKVKGKILTIDRAALGVKEKLIDTLYRMVNDQVLEYDSSAAGNLGGRQLDPAMMFKEIDLGLSQSFQYLLAFKEDLRNEIDAITGISNNRMGQTAASSTATAQQTDISNSRIITEALFYGFSGFVKRVLKAIVDKSAISYAFYRTEESEQILGSERHSFLQATVDLAYRDYALSIEDGSLYAELSQKIEHLMEVSLNAKELRTMDAMNVMLSQTLAQKKAYLELGWETVNKIAQEQAEAERQNQAAIAEAQLATQVQLSQEEREDLQKHEMDKEILKGQVQMEVDDNKTKGNLQVQNLKNINDINLHEPNTGL